MSKHISNTFENDYFHTFSIDMLCAMSIIWNWLHQLWRYVKFHYTWIQSWYYLAYSLITGKYSYLYNIIVP